MLKWLKDKFNHAHSESPLKTADLKRIDDALSAYQSDAFVLPPTQVLELKSASYQQGGIALVFQAPYALKQEAAALATYLTTQCQTQVFVTIEVFITHAPQFAKIKHIVLIASGKGGVGKSTVTANLAQALNAQGAKVGVLDADIYGPSIPQLFNVKGVKASAKDQTRLNPVDVDGVKLQSLGFLVPPDDATVWRGPMASSALSQLLNETDFGELDYLLVDMPPGTGDIQLTMSQKTPASGAVIVTTPQSLALDDAKKGINMFAKVNMPVLGVVENMSYFLCGTCHSKNAVFDEDGGKLLASQHNVPLLGAIPLSERLRQLQEQGKLAQLLQHQLLDEVHAFDSELAKAWLDTAARFSYQLYSRLSHASVQITITDD